MRIKRRSCFLWLSFRPTGQAWKLSDEAQSVDDGTREDANLHQRFKNKEPLHFQACASSLTTGKAPNNNKNNNKKIPPACHPLFTGTRSPFLRGQTTNIRTQTWHLPRSIWFFKYVAVTAVYLSKFWKVLCGCVNSQEQMFCELFKCRTRMNRFTEPRPHFLKVGTL